MRTRAMVKATASLGYLQRELLATNVLDTREAINRLIETQVQRRMLASVTEQFAFRIVDAALPSDSDDRAVWRFCQERDMLLLTGNRSMKGEDSLEQVLREETKIRPGPF